MQRLHTSPISAHSSLLEDGKSVVQARVGQLETQIPLLSPDAITLEKPTPATCYITKPQQNEFDPAHLTSIVQSAFSHDPFAYGREANVYHIAGSHDLVLRAHYVKAKEPISVDSTLRAIPISYTGSLAKISQRGDIGLPRFLIVPSHFAWERDDMSPGELQWKFPNEGYQLLNRCPGQSIAQRISRFMREFSQSFMAHCSPAIDANGRYVFQRVSKQWEQNRATYFKLYMDHLETIAELPQRTFDDAVACIKTMQDAPWYVKLSLSHGGNIILDEQTQKLYFVDINMTGNGSRGSLEELAMALLGIHRLEVDPWCLFTENPSDRARLREPIARIIRKVVDAGGLHTMLLHKPEENYNGFESMAADLELYAHEATANLR